MMLFEALKKLLRDILGLLNIDDTLHSLMRVFFRGTPVARLTDASAEGSSADPEPLLFTPALESGELVTGVQTSFDSSTSSLKTDEVDQRRQHGNADAVSIAIQRGRKEAFRVSKATLCTAKLSQDGYSTDSFKTAKAVEFQQQNASEPVSEEFRENTDSIIIPKKEDSPPTECPRTASDDDEMCPLYRLCPQLAPGAKNKMYPSSPLHTRVEGKVLFDSPLFSEKDFELRVEKENVCLEFVHLEGKTIRGFIRVANTGYEKEVMVLYTLEKPNWKVGSSCKTKWEESVCDDTMDRFFFCFYGLETVGKVSFQISYNGTFTDDNNGQNYTVAYQLPPSNTSASSPKTDNVDQCCQYGDSDVVSIAIQSSLKEAFRVSKETKTPSKNRYSTNSFTTTKIASTLVSKQVEKTGSRTISKQEKSPPPECPSTASDDDEMCPLYRLCPQLAPGAKNKMYPSSPLHTRVEGKVLFDSPLSSEKEFELRVEKEKVCLEYVQLEERMIQGFIRVANTGYEKEVMVLYTLEKPNWKVGSSCKAKWEESVCDGTMDRFFFCFYGLETVGKVSFQISYNGTFTDDNNGQNYTVAYA